MNTVYPRFGELPLRPGDPPFSAWSLWGQDDETGTLNHLVPSVVREAVKDVQYGERYSLNWSLTCPETPGFGRTVHKLEHKIHQVPGALILDDTLQNLNTQRSSQWDGLRHFAYQKERLFYNSTSPSTILSPDSDKLGIQRWSEIGGVVGRGVLIDYAAWAESQGRRDDMCTSTKIVHEDLLSAFNMQQTISSQPLELKSGDILLIRSGFIKAYQSLTPETEIEHGMAFPMHCAGVYQDTRTLEWLWENKFAAVGGDAEGWECLPADESAGFTFHEVLLSGWGCPIAELLWLEDLAKACRKRQKWTFLFTGSPLNIRGGVASPANAIAIL